MREQPTGDDLFAAATDGVSCAACGAASDLTQGAALRRRGWVETGRGRWSCPPCARVRPSNYRRPAAGRAPANKGLSLPTSQLVDEDVRAVVRAAGNTPAGLRNKALVAILYGAGLRISEAVRLAPGDVEMHESELHRGRVHVRGSRARVIDLQPAWTGFVVQVWRRLHEDLDLPLYAPLLCSLPRSGAADAGRLSETWVRTTLTRLGRRAQVPRVHAEGLRMSHMVVMVEAGASLREIQRQLGYGTLAGAADAFERLQVDTLGIDV
jgi:integrase/recombinase XerD